MKIVKISLPILLMLVVLPYVALAGLSLNTNPSEDAPTADFNTAQITPWHDDCSSTDGWTYYTDWSGWTRWDTASGTLDSTGGYLHCPSNTGWATGPFWFKELDSTFTLADFESVEIEVETNQPSQSYKGNLFFTVFDSEGDPIFYIGVYSWDELEHRVHIYTGLYHDDMSAESYYVLNMAPDFYGTIEIYYDSSDGLMATIPGGGSGQILSPTEWSSEESRVVKYVGLQWRKGSGIYLDHRVHDIHLNAGGVSSSTTTTTSMTTPSGPQDWHDDCTNTAGWTYYTEWDGWSPWDFASGTLASDNGYLHCPTNTGWTTGPFWFKEFDTPFTLAEFDSLEVEVETIQPSQSYKGNLRFTIFDDSKNPIFYIAVNSWDELEHAVHISVGYYYADITSTGYVSNDMDPDFHGTLDIHYDTSSGLMGTIPGGPGGGSGVILTPAEWASESTRVAKYVGIQWRKGAGIYLDHRVHDISIEVTSSSTSSTDGLLPPSLDFTGLLGMGITLGTFAVIIIIGGGIYCRQRGAAPVTSDFTYG